MNRLAALHEPYAPLLRAALARLSTPRPGPALDLGGGAGLKRSWLAATLAAPGLVIGLDNDRAALPAADGPAICADAHALPLAPASCGRCWCVAALNQFSDPLLALREARRVLQPGGDLVLAVAGQRWVRRRDWPPAFAQLTIDQHVPPADGLGDDLARLLAAASFVDILVEAYLLEHAAAGAWAAALPLLDWAQLQALPGAPWAAALSAAGITEVAIGEPEPLDLLLTVRGVAA